MHGNGRQVGLGVVARNGCVEPWACGRAPAIELSDNAALGGIAAWHGMLLGFTPARDAVGERARVTVDLERLQGEVDFTGLRFLDREGAWGDGRQVHQIAVRGNTFRDAGGDDGRLTGALVGRNHEGATGTPERADLTAAFGAQR